MENNNAHTPGPWELQGPKIQKDFGDQTYWTILPNPFKSKADQYIAIGFFYPYSGHTAEEQKSNAELIASAPQLKEENERLKKQTKKLMEALLLCQQTIDNIIHENLTEIK